MDFPCIFNLKVIGITESELEKIILTAMRNNGVDVEKVRFAVKPSKMGRYTSYTVTFGAHNQEQLDNIYRELSANPNIMIVL